MQNLNLTEIRNQIEAVLSRANGRRWARIVDYDDAMRAISEALRRPDWIGWVHGGTVPWSYRSPAKASLVHAWRDGVGEDARVVVSAAVVSARYERKTGYYSPVSSSNQVVIPLAVARLLLRDHRKSSREQAVKILADLPRDVEVTRQDSLAAGNCPHETDAVAQALGNPPSIGSGDLIDWIADHRPDLARFARRAILRAAQAQPA